MSTPALCLEKVERRYDQAGSPLEILRGADFCLWAGQSVALVAPSGAGKSTLLHIAGLLEPPDAGEVFIAGEATVRMADDQRTALRRGEIGFVYQFHHLLPEFSALENVAMPLLMKGIRRQEAEKQALQWLQEVGLAERASHRSGELSGGEQQRVALARALVTRPKILMADEPTGDLDNRTADAVFDLISKLHRDYRLTSLIVTHNHAFARRCGSATRRRPRGSRPA
jgi:lipoprotein-releasing system ATP-binding protein